VTRHERSTGAHRSAISAALVAAVTVLFALVCSASPASDARGPGPAETPAVKITPSLAAVPRYLPRVRVLAVTRPQRLDIPSIGVSTKLVGLGLEPDGTMEVPADYQKPGWYEGSARPGEDGPAVIAGHVDSTTGPAIFFRLRELRAGDAVRVTRRDGSVAHFVIDHLEEFPKDAFPTASIFGPTPGPSLRLVTCSGAFDETRRSYLQNLVAFATPAAR
jgi:Sortase domain